MAGMTAKSKGVKKRTVVRRKTRSGSSYTPPKLPKKPKVTVGAKSYGRTKKGAYIVPRFYITQQWLGYAKLRVNGPWFVMDVEEANLAAGTKKAGYPEKDKAIAVARRYRDTYGAWAIMPF